MYSFDVANDRLTISGGTDWDATYDVISLSQTELILKISADELKNARLPSYNYYKFSICKIELNIYELKIVLLLKK